MFIFHLLNVSFVKSIYEELMITARLVMHCYCAVVSFEERIGTGGSASINL